MRRIAVLVYGLGCYATFFSTFLYACGFIGGFGVPKTIDSGAEAPLGSALLVNLALLSVFAVQHSGMARRGFKDTWTKIVPPVAERSTYVLASSLLLIFLFWQWRPMPGVVWQVENATARLVLWALFAFGWGLVLVSTFLINHFDLFGLRQVYLYWRGQPYTHLPFATPGPYRYVRHPLYVGWLFGFWATPTMTVGHLLFAAVTTSYILVAIVLEERDLAHYLGAPYEAYRQTVPKLIPFTRRG